ncbi:alpha/beta hydrolase [Fundicoccus culcitae]|uniref:Alpha/beta fold hydrolase n=1 Tax=Fundicoccus culcitae TaxID=2969821 RepID=A0ABY5P335_9LACT|nr:alpha/beta fold hydrolase [Fundicoccus culcitae]UUX32900.1 alpha/beta fold hydrolase [Fundicoccus culcitae]
MSHTEIYFKEGRRAVLLLHAYTGSVADIRRTARALQKANYTVYSYNLSGHGTDRVEDVLASSPTEWYASVKEAVAFLHEEGFQEIAILGLSLGGTLATRATIDHLTTIGAGVFNSPVTEASGEGSRVHRYFLKIAEKQKRDKGLSTEEIENEMEAIKIGIVKQLDDIKQFSHGVRENLDKITLPFYIAQSQKDELIHPQAMVDLKNALVNAPVTFESFPESTHVITIGKEYKRFQESVIRFLDKLAWTV